MGPKNVKKNGLMQGLMLFQKTLIFSCFLSGLGLRFHTGISESSRRFARTRHGATVVMKLQPMLRSPCLSSLSDWAVSPYASADQDYAEGLEASRRWVEAELGDLAFGNMDEDEQRRIDSWGFAVHLDDDELIAKTGDEIGGVLCAELVTQIGKDSRFYWPTMRLVYLSLAPSLNRGPRSLEAAGSSIMRAAKGAMEVCDANGLRLDYSMLRLTLAKPLKLDPELNSCGESKAMNIEDPLQGQASVFDTSSAGKATAIEWVDGEVNWDSLFAAVRGRDAYSEDDYIPGAT